MHLALLITALLLIAPAAAAQVQFYGTLGIYDDPAHTQTSGTMAPGLKTIYLGVELDRGDPFDALTGLEFSISGLDAVLVVGMDVQPAAAIVLGDVHAPVDTMSGTGGINLAWPTCVPDSAFSVAITIASPAPPIDHVLQVRRRYPPAVPYLPHVLAPPCVGPCYCFMSLTGGRYTLNPAIALESRAWSVVKNLYRGP